MTQKKMVLSETTMLPIDRIRPYWRNPRDVPEEAVDALVTSIREFGYQQPLVVDKDNVIVVGHTRYAALRRLDYTEVPVVVCEGLTPQQVKQYRLIDNKVSEFSSWDYELLVSELEGTERALLDNFFPEFTEVEAVDVLQEEQELLTEQWDEVDDSVEFICPECYHEFHRTVTREDVMTGVLK